MPLFSPASRKFLTISELNDLIKGTLENHLDALWVQGEISNFRVPPSGHFYFTLKDDRCQIAAVMFRRQGARLRFVPENGMAVLCYGRVSVYSPRGDLQLCVEDLEPQGQGALYLAFEQLKNKLAAEGLFAPERKRLLPFLPDCIGIVTSDHGAALHDMLRILRDRFSERRVIIRPVTVQGDGAAREIAAGIADLNRFGAVDVIIVGRGGGSLEDLWAFNEEIVARAICASRIPVISAVGHEIDFTIADLVADQRAPTPTAAAEMVVPRKADLLEQIETLDLRLQKCMEFKLSNARENFRRWVKRLADPGRKLRENQQRVDELSVDLLRRLQTRLRECRDRLNQETGRLNALSPLAVLERGYSITHKLSDEHIVKDAAALSAGDRVRITFALGKALCRVEGKE
ncbi:MAG: exodeoxyribonuclease VII large subunit [Candidatus Binatia bacterium]